MYMSDGGLNNAFLYLLAMIEYGFDLSVLSLGILNNVFSTI